MKLKINKIFIKKQKNKIKFKKRRIEIKIIIKKDKSIIFRKGKRRHEKKKGQPLTNCLIFAYTCAPPRKECINASKNMMKGNFRSP
jgi:hypothetical protein